jgi:hypothetical protein
MRLPTLLVLPLLAACQASPAPAPAPAPAPTPAPAASAAPAAQNPVRLTVVQRGREKVPGTEGRLWIEVDDVTAGQVLVKIVDRMTREDALPQRSMRFGDEAWFPLGGGTRAVVVLRLANLLIGEDFVEFAFGEPGAMANEQIESVLRRVANSKMTFVREGTEHDAVATALWLRQQWLTAGDVRTLAAFLARFVGSEGGPVPVWSVRLPGGRLLPLVEWLSGS